MGASTSSQSQAPVVSRSTTNTNRPQSVIQQQSSSSPSLTSDLSSRAHYLAVLERARQEDEYIASLQQLQHQPHVRICSPLVGPVTSRASSSLSGATVATSQPIRTDRSIVASSSTSTTVIKPLPPPPQTSSSSSSSTTANDEVAWCCPFKKGEKVKVIAITVDELRSLSSDNSGWKAKPLTYMNKTGIINGIRDNREVTVHLDDSQIVWTFDSESTIEHAIGDIVKLIDSESRLKTLQRGHGEYVPEMRSFLGQRGIIFKVFTDGDLSVSFDGGTWTLNPKCVISLTGKVKQTEKTKPNVPNRRRPRINKTATKVDLKAPENASINANNSKSDPVTSKMTSQPLFTIGDQVKVIAIKLDQLKELQKGHGGWNPKMASFINKTGIVLGLTDNQDVTIMLNNTRSCWTFNPEALRKLYIGDRVKVIKDLKVEKISKSGKLTPEMNIRGECGFVMDTNNDGDFIVRSGKNKWILKPSSVMNLSELERSKVLKKITKDNEEEQEKQENNQELFTWKKWINELVEENSEVTPSLTSSRSRCYKTDEDSNISHLIAKNRRLQEEINKMEEANSCGICLENSKNVIFLCGHGTCSQCAQNLIVCHMCRKYLSYKIPVY